MKNLALYLLKYNKSKIKLLMLPFCIVVEAGLLVLLAAQMSPIVNLLSAGKNQEALINIVCYVGLVLLYILFRWLGQLIIASMASESERMVYDEMVDMISRMKPYEVYQVGKGTIIALLNNELRQNKLFILSYLYELIYQPIIFILTVFYIVRVNFMLAFVMAPMMLITVFISYINSNKLSMLYSEKNADTEQQLTIQRDIFANIATLKLYDIDNYLCGLNKNACHKLYVDEKEYAKRKAINYFPSLINEYLPTIVLVFTIMILMKNNSLNYGQFASVLQLLATMSLPFSKYADTIIETRNTCVTVNKIDTFFKTNDVQKTDMQCDEENEYDGKYLLDISGLSFSYDDRKVLDNCSLRIMRGEHVGIVGSSGVGKSTLLNVLLGVLPDYEGTVKIFGEEIREANIEKLWSHISYVDQNRYMLNENIAFNISAGDTNVMTHRIDKVLDMTNFRNDIENKLPMGIETVLNEGGSNLSGGQKEKIAIARALYKKAELFILDEPSSALDEETDNCIVDALDVLDNVTIITISHRLSTLSKCDRILELQNGKLIQVEKN